MKLLRKALLLMAIFGVNLLPSSSFGLSYTYDLQTTFSNTVAPTDPKPWLKITFEDSAANTVKLTLQSDLAGSGKFEGVYFNFGPSVDPILTNQSGLSNLSFAYQTSSSTGPSYDSINLAADSKHNKADGVGGNFDIKMEFPTSGNTFDSFDEIMYLITANNGKSLDASMFDYACTVGVNDPPGALYAAAHFQDANGGDSTWIGDGDGGTPVPEPGTFILLGAGIAGLAFYRRKQKR
jgi:PEP-CTERM motif-containing protein